MTGVGLGATEQLEGVSSIYVPAEKVVLHQHVLNTLLQRLLLLLCTEQPQSPAGTTLEPHRSLLQPRLHHSPPGKGNARNQPGHIRTSLLAGSSQSWERLKAKQQRTLGTKEQSLVILGCSANPPASHTTKFQALQSCPLTYRSSHLIWTQPGLRRKDQGWYHFSTVGRLEQRTSSHRCRTCSLGRRQQEDGA